MRELQCNMGANETLLFDSRHRKAPAKNQKAEITHKFFFHSLCDLSQLQKGETISKLNPGCCSNFSFGLTQAYPLPHVKCDHKNVSEVQIAFENASLRKTFPNSPSLFHIPSFRLLLNLFFILFFCLFVPKFVSFKFEQTLSSLNFSAVILHILCSVLKQLTG